MGLSDRFRNVRQHFGAAGTTAPDCGRSPVAGYRGSQAADTCHGSPWPVQGFGKSIVKSLNLDQMVLQTLATPQ